MLHVFYSLRKLNFGNLMELYCEGNEQKAADDYPNDERNVAVMKIEQEFYQYLKEVFFPVKGAFYAVWEEKGRYISALRLEPYRDGLLLEALETHPDFRRQGYSKRLILSVLEFVGQQGVKGIYAHVHKRNEASIRTHLTCGFRRISEHAVYIDGSVNSQCCTFEYFF